MYKSSKPGCPPMHFAAGHTSQNGWLVSVRMLVTVRFRPESISPQSESIEGQPFTFLSSLQMWAAHVSRGLL